MHVIAKRSLICCAGKNIPRRHFQVTVARKLIVRREDNDLISRFSTHPEPPSSFWCAFWAKYILSRLRARVTEQTSPSRLSERSTAIGTNSLLPFLLILQTSLKVFLNVRCVIAGSQQKRFVLSSHIFVGRATSNTCSKLNSSSPPVTLDLAHKTKYYYKLAEINEFLLQERFVSTVTTEDEKEARYLIKCTL